MVTHQLNLPFREDQRPAFLALCQMTGVGYWTLRNLATQLESFEDAFESPSIDAFFGLLMNAGYKSKSRPNVDWRSFRDKMLNSGRTFCERLEANGIDLLFRSDGTLPEKLTEIDDSPDWLFVQGQKSVLWEQSVAVVGTRKATKFGKWLTWQVCDLIDKRQATVSGLAYGIDQEAHVASLKYGVSTIAVLGCGILLDYPAGSEETRARICENGGAIVSEYLPNDRYSAQNFVRRNRIQAALAHTVVPVQWAVKSGTAHTVRFAHAFSRRIACPKRDTWNLRDHPELESAIELGAEVFEIPSQLELLRSTLNRTYQNGHA